MRPALWRKDSNKKHEAILRPQSSDKVTVDYYMTVPWEQDIGDDDEHMVSRHVFSKTFSCMKKARDHLRDAGYVYFLSP